MNVFITQGTVGSPETPPLKEKQLDIILIIDINYNTKNIIKGGGFRGNLGSPEFYLRVLFYVIIYRISINGCIQYHRNLLLY
jgi:hypothetical protein